MKRIKSYLLATLLFGSSLAIILPIVSCSSSSVISLRVIKRDGPDSNVLLETLGVLIARVGVGNNNINTNTSELTLEQFNIAKTASYNGEIRTLINQYFSFKNGEVGFNNIDVIDKIIINGTYPQIAGPINVDLVLDFKPRFTAPEADRTVSLRIGTYNAPPTIV